MRKYPRQVLHHRLIDNHSNRWVVCCLVIHMKNRFEPIAVETDEEGNIRIVQDDRINEPHVIVITCEQVPLLVSLLREAEAELETDQAKNAG